MDKLRRILVATDFSAPSKRALAAALSLAELFSAQVDVLNVGALATGYEPLDRAIFGRDHTDDISKAVREAAGRGMEAFLADLSEDDRKRVGRRIEWGTPYQVVTRIAEQGGYGLIVVGSHGWSGAKHVLMGSVAERIVRHATCPVLTVR